MEDIENYPVTTPKLPLNDLPDKIREKIQKCYDNGNKNLANMLIKKYAQYDSDENVRHILTSYLESIKLGDISNCTILTTHERMMRLKGKLPDTIIFDEDPYFSLNQTDFTTKEDLISIQRILTGNERVHFTEILEYINAQEYDKTFSLQNCNSDILIKASEDILDSEIVSNVFGLLDSHYVIKDKYSKRIQFIHKRKLPEDKKIIILSATANETVYKEMYGDRVVFYDIGQVETIGNVIQYPQFNCSRNDLHKNPEQLTKIERIMMDKYNIDINIINSIIFKSFAKLLGNCGATFGGLTGLDKFKGDDLLVIGTPHCSNAIYKLYAAALGHFPTQKEMNSFGNRKILRNGYEYYFATFSEDSILREIQLNVVEGELIQAIGRARILRFDCTVYLFSNLPIPGATIINP